MKKLYVLLMASLFTLTIIGCDKDECPKCNECECVCEKQKTVESI